MEYIKTRSGYLVKNSNGLIVSEDEKKELENGTLQFKEETCEACQINKNKQQNTTATSIKEKKKKNKKIVEEVIEEPINEEVGVVKDDNIEETSIII